MKRTLRLHRDALTELTPSDLADVVGAEAITQYCNTIHFCDIPTLPLRDCLKK